MITTHELWASIVSCDDRNSLSSGAWKALHEIARRMSTENFSTGQEKDLGRKLLKALGYSGWKELKNASQLQSKLNFINECEKRAKEYKSINNFFESGKAVKLGDISYHDDVLKHKYYETIESLDMFHKQYKEGFMEVKDVIPDDMLDDMTPIDKYREETIKHLSAEKVKAHKKQRQGKLKSSDKV
jgi:hypothetical protein